MVIVTRVPGRSLSVVVYRGDFGSDEAVTIIGSIMVEIMIW